MIEEFRFMSKLIKKYKYDWVGNNLSGPKMVKCECSGCMVHLDHTFLEHTFMR